MLENYHVIELIGEGSFGKARSGYSSAAYCIAMVHHQCGRCFVLGHLCLEPGSFAFRTDLPPLSGSADCAGQATPRNASGAERQRDQLPIFACGAACLVAPGWPCHIACVQVYKGRRKCTGQITAMKFILKQGEHHTLKGRICTASSAPSCSVTLHAGGRHAVLAVMGSVRWGVDDTQHNAHASARMGRPAAMPMPMHLRRR